MTGGPLSRRLAGVERLCRRLEDRLDWGPDAPVLAAVLGATGTGKSKIFNSLAGRTVSPSGFKRPTTLAPVLLAKNDLTGLDRPLFFPGYEKREAEAGEASFGPAEARELIIVRDDATLAGLVLIDTPDFDSVIAANRQAARDVFDRCDAVIFVTDAVKYADQAAWDYLERLRQRDKTAILVVNRLKNPMSRDDFSRRLNEAGINRTILTIPDLPELADDDVLPLEQAGLADLRARLSQWAEGGRAEMVVREASADWDELRRELQEGLLPELDHASADLSALAQGLDGAGRRLADGLEAAMTVSISGELKNSLIDQIQTLFLRWDLLKYPRRIMSLPFNLVRDKVLAPLGLGTAGGRRSLDQEIDRLFEANRESLVLSVQEYNRLAVELFHGSPAGQNLSGRTEFDDLALTADQVRAEYEKARADLEQWVTDQAAELVKGLNLGEKMTFYLAQVVSLGLFISIQVHTGGGFSFFDGLVDTALAPILSKLSGSALSRDKVKAFEERAFATHLQGCREIILGQAALYKDYLARAEQGLSPAGSLAEAARELIEACEALS